CFLDLLRCRKQISHFLEIVRMRLPRIAIEKCICAQKDRAVGRVEGGRHNAIMQWRRVKKNIEPAHEWQQCADRKSKTMKQRQGVEESVAIFDIRDGKHLSNIGQNVTMGQLNAFGGAFRTAGEKHDGGFFRRVLRRSERCVVRDRVWNDSGAQEGEELPPAGDCGTQIFEIDNFDASFEKWLRLEF